MYRINKFFIFFLLFFHSFILSDTIFLKNGGKVTGIIKSQSGNSIIIDFGFGEMGIDTSEIDSISHANSEEQATIKGQWEIEREKHDEERTRLLLKEDEPSEKRIAVTLKPIKLFVTEWCGYCKKLRELFIANKIKFIECDIEKSAECKAEYDKYRGKYKGIPLSVVGNRVISGYNPAAIQNALNHPSAWERANK